MEEKLQTIIDLLNEQNRVNSKLNAVFLTKLTLIENLVSASLMPEPHKAQAILACKDLILYSKEVMDELKDIR